MNLAPNIAPLSNVAALITLTGRVKDRDLALPGMACFYGPSGFGKTTATTVAANEFQAHVIQVKSVWTPSFLCQAILHELHQKPRKTIPEMVDQIAACLMRTDAPLIIDDAQELVRKGMIHVVKDIYESCQAPVVLVGEEALPQVLTRWENVHNRMLDWVPAEACNFDDALRLSTIYSADVEIDDALLGDIVDASSGAIRRVVVNITRARELALTRGASAVSRTDWGSRPFFDGQPPSIRTGLGAPQGRVLPLEKKPGRRRA